MKYRLFLWMMAALLVVAGCTNDEIASEQPTPEAEKAKLPLRHPCLTRHHKPASAWTIHQEH
jgi:hypothetical protein